VWSPGSRNGGEAIQRVAFRPCVRVDLVDVYSYVRSIPVAAPPADSIPLLKGIIDKRQQAK